MTTDRDLERLLSAWFDEAASVTAAPDGLLARSLARVDVASQRPGWLVRDRGRSRRDDGRLVLAVTAGVAVALVVVGVGIGVLLRRPDAQVAAPSASSTVAPSASPRPTAGRPLSPGAWTVTGGMHTARSGHTATLLLDGRVLVAGGSNGDVSLASAELYDPATGIWTATASMTEVLGGDTATLLLDGRVLVTGRGRHSTRPNVIESAELYVPATGSWTTTGSPATVHGNGAAVLLRDGRVLLVGGGRSAELYDPATGSWTAAAPMGTGRFGPVVLLLPDGRPLVLGGSESPAFGPLSSAEIYDPIAGTWTYTWTMNDSASAAAVLADGRVVTTAGVLDLATGWSSVAPPPSPANLQSATLLPDGRVLMLGAALSHDKVTGPAADLFDPATGSWAASAMPATQRWSPTVTRLLDGRVLVAGGWPEAAPNSGSTPMLSSAELYDPEGGQ